jgi:hypothetical protein
MKKLIIQSEIIKEVPINKDDGSTIESIPYHKAWKISLSQAVNFAPYSLENSRRWTNIGNKINEAGDEVTLEDDDLKLLKQLVTAGIPTAFPTMGQRLWADEIMHVIDSAEEIN